MRTIFGGLLSCSSLPSQGTSTCLLMMLVLFPWPFKVLEAVDEGNVHIPLKAFIVLACKSLTR